MNLYLTADKIGTSTGGGVVTYNEREALKELGELDSISRDELGNCSDPWGWDEKALELVQGKEYKLCHIYSGTFSKTVQYLKERGTKIVYTIAAHDKKVSQEEHEKYAGGFPYKHLTDSALWNTYITGYRLADCIVCPSTYSKSIVESYGGCDNIRVIPHGCETPKVYVEPPSRLVVGYLGSIGLDKGLIYLCQAWKQLNYKDDSMLIIAGRESSSPFMYQIWRVFGGGNVTFGGWQRSVSHFYNKISLYVQPSATEGFGLEILEAMAHGRAVIASKNCGGPDLCHDFSLVEARDVNCLASKLDTYKGCHALRDEGLVNKKRSEQFTWDIIRQTYKNLWSEYL